MTHPKILQRRRMMKEIADGSTRYLFWKSMKLPDDNVRNCQFCGAEFLPGQQSGIDELPHGFTYWRRTLCSVECNGLRHEMRRRALRASWIKKGSTPSVVVDRVAILKHDKYICYLCGSQTEHGYRGQDKTRKSEIDHIVPLASGGSHHPDNVRCCCARCNLEKGMKTLQEAIHIATCGDVDFNEFSITESPVTLDELISAWRQWVLPTIDESPHVQAYVDPKRRSAWTALYRTRIAHLEALVATEPGNRGRKDDLSLAYIGFSEFLRKYGDRQEALAIQRKRLTICETFAVTEPDNRARKLQLAICLFNMARSGADVGAEIDRLSSLFDRPEMQRLLATMRTLEEIEERRATNLPTRTP